MRGRVKEPRVLPIVANGFAAGLLLQAAVGPVFFFILNTTLQRTVYDGLLAVGAVTLVDCFYILLAGVGVGRLLERPRIRLAMRIGSSAVLAAFGVVMWLSALAGRGTTGAAASGSPSHAASFLSALLLTLSSPLTIVFWTGLFAAKAAEKGYGRRELIPFGLGAGTSTAVFLSLAVVVFALLRSAIPVIAVRVLNAAVASLLIAYAVVRLAKGIWPALSGRPRPGPARTG